MALTSTGLSDLQGLGAGRTTNFHVQIEDTLSNQDNVVANANALLPVLESEFTVTTGWFNTPSGKFGAGQQQIVNLNLGDTLSNEPGANNNGHGKPINLDAQNLYSGMAAADKVQNVFMAEWSEVLMSLTGTWNAGDSSGEGLSQFTSIIRFQDGHYDYYTSFVNAWLNGDVNSPHPKRSDWVSNTFKGATITDGSWIHGDADQVSYGCSLAFLFYLNIQLGFSISSIIGAYTGTMATIYNELTGDPNSPFQTFLDLIASVYPASDAADIPGPLTDNPFPLATHRSLSSLRFLEALKPDKRTQSIRELIAQSSQASLRPALNSNRVAALI